MKSQIEIEETERAAFLNGNVQGFQLCPKGKCNIPTDPVEQEAWHRGYVDGMKRATNVAQKSGTDYGLGKTNVDKSTNIRYGVQPIRELSQYFVYEDFEADYGEPSCPSYGHQVSEDNEVSDWTKEGCLEFLETIEDTTFEEHYWDQEENTLEDLRDHVANLIEDQKDGEYYCPDCDESFESEDAYPEEANGFYYTSDGYEAHYSGDCVEVWVTKSPYFTYAQFCSPCAPGAGYLGSPCPEGVRTYCFGHDCFEGAIAPYPVYSVATGKKVLSPEMLKPRLRRRLRKKLESAVEYMMRRLRRFNCYNDARKMVANASWYKYGLRAQHILANARKEKEDA